MLQWILAAMKGRLICDKNSCGQVEQRARHKPTLTWLSIDFWKGASNTQREKDSVFSNRCWENWISTYKRLKLDPDLAPLTIINLKWIKDLNIRPDIIKTLEENIGKKLLDTVLGNDFLDKTSRAQAAKAKINKQDCIKLKSFGTVKETINKLKRQPRESKKIFTKHVPDNG